MQVGGALFWRVFPIRKTRSCRCSRSLGYRPSPRGPDSHRRWYHCIVLITNQQQRHYACRTLSKTLLDRSSSSAEQPGGPSVFAVASPVDIPFSVQIDDHRPCVRTVSNEKCVSGYPPVPALPGCNVSTPFPCNFLFTTTPRHLVCFRRAKRDLLRSRHKVESILQTSASGQVFSGMGSFSSSVIGHRFNALWLDSICNSLI